MKTLKLLVIDDEPGICAGIKRTLKNFTLHFPFLEEDLNFDVLTTGTGEDGLDAFDKEKPDIVLLDNKLPGIQGIDVLDIIAKKDVDCKVAMITAYPSLDVAVEATDEGAADFIHKPFTPQELKSSITTIAKQLFLNRITAQIKKEGRQTRFQFLSVLSHELKSPLNAILGYLEMMKEKQMGDSLGDYDKLIERSIARANGMKALIMDLLDLTKIQQRHAKKDLQNVDLVECAKFAMDTVRPLAIQKDIELKLDAPEQICCLANPEDMEMIFNNLISNAVKYNFDKGTVNCLIQENNDEIIINVKDTGIGMTEEEKSKLFREFVRIKNENTKNITGSGLGLSIVKRIADLYEGDIKVESEKNKGSLFTVSLSKRSKYQSPK
jgi:signal transduction histidine kinase